MGVELSCFVRPLAGCGIAARNELSPLYRTDAVGRSAMC